MQEVIRMVLPADHILTCLCECFFSVACSFSHEIQLKAEKRRIFVCGSSCACGIWHVHLYISLPVSRVARIGDWGCRAAPTGSWGMVPCSQGNCLRYEKWSFVISYTQTQDAVTETAIIYFVITWENNTFVRIFLTQSRTRYTYPTRLLSHFAPLPHHKRAKKSFLQHGTDIRFPFTRFVSCENRIRQIYRNILPFSASCRTFHPPPPLPQRAIK